MTDFNVDTFIAEYVEQAKTGGTEGADAWALENHKEHMTPEFIAETTPRVMEALKEAGVEVSLPATESDSVETGTDTPVVVEESSES